MVKMSIPPIEITDSESSNPRWKGRALTPKELTDAETFVSKHRTPRSSADGSLPPVEVREHVIELYDKLCHFFSNTVEIGEFKISIPLRNYSHVEVCSNFPTIQQKILELVSVSDFETYVVLKPYINLR